MKKPKPDNVLVIADTHIPFERKDYLDFCLQIKDRCRCGVVVHIGDLVDNHSISYHEHDPNGRSPIDEMEEADKHLKDWFKAFKEIYLCLGNHDRLVDRKSKTAGLPSRAFRPFRHIWNLPNSWHDGYEWDLFGVRYIHGTGMSGHNAHKKAAFDHRQSTCIGHLHSVAGVEWSANSKDCIFGMCVGSGIDHKAYSFAYGREFRNKPIIGCGVVTDGGRYAEFMPMSL